MKKRNKVKQFIRNGLSRILVILLATAVQIALQLAFMTWLRDKLAWIEAVLHILGIIITIAILKNSRHLSTDILWILLINAFPIVGTILYIFLGADLFFSRTYRDIYNATEDSRRYYLQDETIMEELAQIDPYKHSQLEYISDYAGYPVYRNYGFDYYPLGELAYPVILEELRKAKHFIFLEYFIIEQGEFWDSILAILEEKGIKCIPFNRINIILNVIINHRDHRKIMVIDGKVAFSGGVNLADEYINRIVRFGHWKDTAIMLRGKAVSSFTLMFLQMWNLTEAQPA
ncbi:MAG: PLDc N-terminal domain-containing protein, partial [Erysipelotrichaceae bacterium]|nr:PLDc N-terminal domain-containing protein [Erysipelotrichaceae bacterium]